MNAEILFAAAIGLFSLIAILNNPYFGLLIFTSFLYLRPADFFPALETIHITRIIAAATFLVLLFKKVSDKESILKRTSETYLLTALLALIFVSISASIWKANSLIFFTNLLRIYIGFLLVTNLVTSVKRLRMVIWVMVLSGLVIGLASVINYMQGENLVGNNRVRAIVTGMFSNPNDLALCFLMLIPFAYFLFVRSKSLFIKLFLASGLMIFLLGFIFTQSRGGFVALFGLLLFLFLRSRKKIRLAAGLSLCVFLFFSFGPASYIERIRTIPLSHHGDPNTISRLDAWDAGLKMMLHHPLGVGIGNFGEGFVIYRSVEAIDLPGVRRAAHNSFIQIGAEAGIPGLILYLLLIHAALKHLNHTRNKLANSQAKGVSEIVQLSDAVTLSMVGFLISALFLSQAYNWIFYYLVGFSVVLGEFAKRGVYEKAS